MHNEKFRARMISMLLRRSFTAQYGIGILKPSYFETIQESMLVRHILAYIQQYRHPPSSADVLLTYAGKDAERIAGLAATVFELARSREDELFTTETIIEFARAAAIKQAMIASVDDIEAGDLETPVERIQEASKVGVFAMADTGLDLLDDADEWMSEIAVQKISTGWLHVDRLLRGGLARKELGVILAPPNKGKTMSLINIGVGAAGLTSGSHVVHYSLEMSRASVLRRYAARIVFRFRDPYEDDEEYQRQLLKAAKMRIRGGIRVLSFPSNQMTVRDISVHTEQLIDFKLIDPDRLVLIVDYADLLRPHRSNELRHELLEIYTDLRGLAAHFNCPVWTASQAGRQALSKPVVTIEDFAEAFSKAAVSDVVISKCETPEEAMMDTGRLFMAKIRDEAGAGTNIKYKYDERSMAITTTGIVRHYEVDQSADATSRDNLKSAVQGRKAHKRRSIKSRRRGR